MGSAARVEAEAHVGQEATGVLMDFPGVGVILVAGRLADMEATGELAGREAAHTKAGPANKVHRVRMRSKLTIG